MKLAAILLALVALSAQARDPAQVRAFRATHPCPATGKTAGTCPGWVVDHGVPLCASGADAPWNMHWQTLAESRLKDAQERALCARLKACKP